MKCPKLKKWFELEPGQFWEEPLDCLKEECAWWDKAQSWCVMRAINMELVNLFVVLSMIKEKMPSPEFFKK